MIILKANKVNLFVSSVLFVFWYHSPNVLDRPHICNISRLRVHLVYTVERFEASSLMTEDYVQLMWKRKQLHKIQFKSVMMS
jgi:hypothetical protein